MPVHQPRRGHNTATRLNVSYRVGRIAPYLAGTWLDFGCADGGYCAALLAAGASSVVGVDVEEDRIALARQRAIRDATFEVFDGSRLKFGANMFEGAFVNEVLEHVADEQAVLQELLRVLRPGGYLALISPNRWFPIEGHVVNIAKIRLGPAPLIPWLPERLTRSWTTARNYWPHQLIRQVRDAGFAVKETGFIWPVLEQYPWLPSRLAKMYRSHLRQIDRLPGIRRFGVSTLVVGVKPCQCP